MKGQLTALVATALALGGFTSNAALAAKSKARMACPAVSILADATRLTQLQNGRIDLKAEIRQPALTCSIAAGNAKSRLTFQVKTAIAPSSNVATRTVPYFVAIISEGKVIAKEVFQLALPFAGAKRKMTVKEYVDRIDIPIASHKAADDYAVTIGFQLTEEQVEYNRTASVSRP